MKETVEIAEAGVYRRDMGSSIFKTATASNTTNKITSINREPGEEFLRFGA